MKDNHPHSTDLSASPDILSLLADISPVGILVVNEHGQLSYANQRASQILGLPEDSILTRTYNDPDWQITDLAGSPLPDDRLPFARVMQTGDPIQDVRISVKRGNGERVALSVNARPLVEDGQVKGIVSTLDDITEQIGLVAVLEQRVEARTAEVQQLYERARRQADETRTLLAIQQALTSQLDPEDVIQLIAEEARRLTGAEYAWFDLVEGDSLRLAHITGEDSSFADAFPPDYRLPIHGSLVGQAVLNKEPVYIPDRDTATEINTDALRRLQSAQSPVRSIMAVPLLSEGDAPGVLLIGSSQPDTFSSEDERLLTMFATSAVIALQNARQYDAEQERRQVAEALRGSLSVLNSNRPHQEILDYIVSQAVDLLGTQAGAIYLVDESGEWLAAQASQGLPADYAALRIPVGNLLTGRAVQTRQPATISDLASSHKTLQDFLTEPGTPDTWQYGVEWIRESFGAVAAIPIQTEDTVFGALTLYYDDTRYHSEEELALATAFADQAALVLEGEALRARLKQAAASEERSRLARDLHDAVTQTLFSASMIAGVLPTLWDKDPEEGQRRLAQLEDLTRGALAEMRTLLLELRPEGIVEGEMKDLLGHLVNAAAGQRTLDITLHAPTTCDLPPDVKVALYRITQEALNNIVKHAEADQVMVSLQCLEGIARLQVLDDGAGFDPNNVSSDHMGLRNIHERATSIDAELTLDTAPGEGTDITLIWQPDRKELT